MVAIPAPTHSRVMMFTLLTWHLVQQYDHREILHQVRFFVPEVVEAHKWIAEVLKYKPYRLVDMEFHNGIGTAKPTALPKGSNTDPWFPIPHVLDFTQISEWLLCSQC